MVEVGTRPTPANKPVQIRLNKNTTGFQNIEETRRD